jgi:DNA-directed RNA polymerase specialized sigma24 family protein
LTGVDATAAVGLREGALSSDTTLAAFAAEHAFALTRFAYLLCGDQQLAEDLVQDAFLSLHRRFGATLPVAAPVAYARRTITNAAISRGRRRASRDGDRGAT